MNSQALATLTATYTDSEGEEDMEYGHTPKREPKISEPEPSTSKQVAETSNAKKKSGTPPRLVSYLDDSAITDEDSPCVEDRDNMPRQSMETDSGEAATCSAPYSVNDVSIPPEPPGKCPKELQDLITKYYNRMINEGLDMNKMIQEKKNFRNPSIYEKLIQYCDINELDTNYPPEIYDPLMWGKESYYDELAKAQALEMKRREKEKRNKIAKLDLVGGYHQKKQESDEEKKRKTKWDQADPNAPAKPVIKQPGMMPPLTTKVTGTKSTVISACGSLPKKSRR